MKEKLSKRVLSLKPSGIREFFAIVKKKPQCISLGVGEPDFITPSPVIHGAMEALREGYTHYTENQGLLSLRKKIASYLEDRYHLSYSPEEEILITVGVSQALELALFSSLNPHEEVLYVEPAYVSYAPLSKIALARPVAIPTFLEEGFKLSPQKLQEKITPKTKLLILNYPSNPTGVVYSYEELLEIAKIVEKEDLLVISDEIYAELTYEKEHIPFSSLPGMKERTALLGGFSKAFAMTGWRIGYLCAPREWLQSALRIHQYSMLCAPVISQIAAEEALSHLEEVNYMREEYKLRKEVLEKALEEMGFSFVKPGGAFYIFARIPSPFSDGLEFAKKLLEEEEVAIVPGEAFGESYKEYVRISYATGLSDIQKAIERMRRFLKKQSYVSFGEEKKVSSKGREVFLDS